MDDELAEQPLEAVPQREPSGTRCNGRKKLKRNGEVVRDEEDRVLFGGYCGNWPGKGTDHVGSGRCSLHGGASPRGMDSPNAVHGLRSDYLSEEDREIYDAVAEQENADLIQEEIWAIKTKLLRAARATNGNEGVGLASELLEKIEDGQADDDVVAALAKLLQVSSSAVDRAIGRLNDLVKTHHKITEGDTVQVEHSGQIDGERTLGEGEKDMLREALDPGA